MAQPRLEPRDVAEVQPKQIEQVRARVGHTGHVVHRDLLNDPHAARAEESERIAGLEIGAITVDGSKGNIPIKFRVNNNAVIRTRQLPLGFLHASTAVAIGSGVAVDPRIFAQEVERYDLGARVTVDSLPRR